MKNACLLASHVNCERGQRKQKQQRRFPDVTLSIFYFPPSSREAFSELTAPFLSIYLGAAGLTKCVYATVLVFFAPTFPYCAGMKYLVTECKKGGEGRRGGKVKKTTGDGECALTQSWLEERLSLSSSAAGS